MAADALTPQKTYNGGYAEATEIRLRIGNGAAGQSGLIGALADGFIQWMVKADVGFKPFKVGWVLSDTTQSLDYLEQGLVDIAITYNEAAENQSLASGAAVEIIYGFRDHFLLTGPPSNPAQLAIGKDDVYTMFNKLNKFGKSATPTDPPTRFLSRFDKSATNIKENSLFIAIGQVPWAYAYSTWYHQYPRFPLQALQASGQLNEYTLTDRGTFLSSPKSVQDSVKIYIAGTDAASDPLLNPARVLRSAKVPSENYWIALNFMTFVKSATMGQKIIQQYSVNNQTLYSPAP
ncbi:hypothetical protein SISNIDRAFT_534191 [Sistotremastrum niveocremeum HHB9708]|uniref:PBP domain-containing protein n=2 Tax=Sistotremastraceae TaxID=3402574 RepID=A0A164YHB6_9AGAM|nr:hypothetical protein SISNIDRAFT_534191 [Sistotremastrum niveocremeum HHB9708]KZT43335.1 hypothetical protein SISSUDRAFT_1068923 [Sistotremastrum suecicum HHB10207 ss-3]